MPYKHRGTEVPIPHNDSSVGDVVLKPPNEHCHFVSTSLDVIGGIDRGRKWNCLHCSQMVFPTCINIQKMKIVTTLYGQGILKSKVGHGGVPLLLKKREYDEILIGIHMQRRR